MKTHIRVDEFSQKTSKWIEHLFTVFMIFWVLNFMIFVETPFFPAYFKQYQKDIFNYLWTSKKTFTLVSLFIFPLYAYYLHKAIRYLMPWVRKKLYANESLLEKKSTIIIRKYMVADSYGDNIPIDYYFLKVKNPQTNQEVDFSIWFELYQKIEEGQEAILYYRNDVKGLFLVEI